MSLTILFSYSSFGADDDLSRASWVNSCCGAPRRLDGAGPPRTDKNDEDENCDERVHRRLHAGWPRVDSILSGGASESAQGGLNVASRGTPLIADSKPGDVLLIEQVDRLSRLTDSDWRKLRAELDAKQIRVVALDLPTSWQLAALADDFTARVFAAINAMMLDTLAAVARKDYDDRRRRQTQGIAKAKAEGKYRGRREDTARHAGIASMLRAGSSYSAIQAAFGCGRTTIAKVAKRVVPAT